MSANQLSTNQSISRICSDTLHTKSPYILAGHLRFFVLQGTPPTLGTMLQLSCDLHLPPHKTTITKDLHCGLPTAFLYMNVVFFGRVKWPNRAERNSSMVTRTTLMKTCSNRVKKTGVSYGILCEESHPVMDRICATSCGES